MQNDERRRMMETLKDVPYDELTIGSTLPGKDTIYQGKT